MDIQIIQEYGKHQRLIDGRNRSILMKTEENYYNKTFAEELVNIGMGQYYDILTMNGLDNLNATSMIGFDELKYMGISDDYHRRALIRWEDRQKVKDWLCGSVKLPQYFDLFMKNGFDDLEIFSELDMEVLEQIGIKKRDHQEEILKHATIFRDDTQPSTQKESYWAAKCSFCLFIITFTFYMVCT